MSSEPKMAGRPGDYVRIKQLGHIVAEPGHDLVAVFLGAAPEGVEPDVPAFLRHCGWTRSHVFQATATRDDGHGQWHQTIDFSADTPRDAAESAIRWALRFDPADGELAALALRLRRVDRIDAYGVSIEQTQRDFLRWHRDSGTALADLLSAAPATSAE